MKSELIIFDVWRFLSNRSSLKNKYFWLLILYQQLKIVNFL